MDFGVTSKLAEYSFGNSRKQNTKTDKSEHMSFLELAALKAAEKASKQEKTTEGSLKEMWQTRFPGGYYHVMDVSKSPEYLWGRYDFPFEKFFNDTVDESVLDWKAKGAQPKLTDSSVQSRLDSTLGKNVIIVPPVLEEKMKNNPILAQRIMAKVENLIVMDEAKVPAGRICSHLIVLEENGEISARSMAASGGGNIVGPTEEEQEQFEAEQKEKEKRRKKYAQLNEESALKRKLQEQEADKVYYHNSKVKEQIFVAYEKNIVPSVVVQK